jgi:MFS family permease
MGDRPSYRRLNRGFGPQAKMTTADIAIPRKQSVEEVLCVGGLSRFHHKAILVTGVAWTFVAMEIRLVGFVQPIFAGLWNLDRRMQGHGPDRPRVGAVVGHDIPLPRRARRRGEPVVDPTMLTEYLPPQRRGRLLVLFDFWWPVGPLLATGLSYVFLGPTFDRFGDRSWRYLFLAAAFPALP